MKKIVFTLNVDDYSREITDKTYPFIDQYARKIGAEFKILNTRKYPDWPVTYEKFQIYDHDFKWAIYIDSDALIHPDTFDVTEILRPDTVMTCKSEFALNHFKYDRYFKRDGRNIYSGNWFTVASDMCRDIWRPLDDISLVDACRNIHTTLLEKNYGVTPAHLIDDYVISRNIAKYGLKYTTFIKILEENNHSGEFLFHEYTYTNEEKLKMINKVLDLWRKG